MRPINLRLASDNGGLKTFGLYLVTSGKLNGPLPIWTIDQNYTSADIYVWNALSSITNNDGSGTAFSFDLYSLDSTGADIQHVITSTTVYNSSPAGQSGQSLLNGTLNLKVATGKLIYGFRWTNGGSASADINAKMAMIFRNFS